MKPNLSKGDHERVRTRIESAEEGTTGEIVTYVVRKSDDYEVATWRGAAVAASFFLIITLLIYLFYDGWDLGWLYTGPGIVGGIVLFGLLGALGVQTVRPVFLAMAGPALLAIRSRARAEQAFIEEGVFRTQGQTGILIFISLWEHRIEIIPDAGVDEIAPPGAWESVVGAAKEELKRGDLVEALVASVDACGVILKRGLPLTDQEHDPNELDDSVRMGD